MNPIYTKIATTFNNWELYPNEASYENSLIIKVFALQFINSFTAVFYIGFYLKSLSTLEIQLAGLLVTGLAINNAQEVLAPYILRKISSYNASAAVSNFITYVPNAKKPDVKKFSTVIEKEAAATEFPGTFNEYSSLMIQFGYVTMFASSFSLAPAIAFISNVLQVRTDGLKLCKYFRRPHPLPAANIGSWLGVLEALSIMSVVTNCFLVYISLVYSPTGQYLPGSHAADSSSEDLHELNLRERFLPSSWRGSEFVILVGIEHFLLVVKYIISVLIPDYPDWIAEDKFRQEIYDQEGTDKLDQQLGTTASQIVNSQQFTADDDLLNPYAAPAPIQDDDTHTFLPETQDIPPPTQQGDIPSPTTDLMAQNNLLDNTNV